MEHYKSRNNDFFHFTNPQDDLSELEDDDSDEQKYYEVNDDRSCDFNFHTFRPLGITQFQPPNFQKSSMMKSNDTLTNYMEELGTFDNGALVFEIDRTMNNLSEKLQCTIEGIGTRLSRLENETCKLDKDVEDVKNSAESYHGAAHRKLRQIESIMLEVQDSVHFIRDKHEIAETHLQLARLQDLKRDQTDLQQQLPIPASQLSCHKPFTHLNQSPSNEASFSQATSYHPPERHPFLSHHSQETPYMPSYGCSSIGQLIPSQELDKGLPQQRHVESSRNYKSEFYAKYMPEAASYEISNLKPVQLSQHPPLTSTRSHYNQLPHAVPIASDAENRSNSVDNGGKILADAIVEKVTAMGFRGDFVKVHVKELTENE